MKPYSKEWYAREKAWADKCERKYEHAAQVLVEEGYAQSKKLRGAIPYTFTKGEETVYLARELGSSSWYPSKQYLN